jgi:hypothetical protein
MARAAKARYVAIVVGATLGKGSDVIALRGQRDAPQALTLHAQGMVTKQAVTHGLQSPACDALRCVGLL